MTFVEKQMACHLLARRDWTWPEIFSFLELVTQKPLEADERRALQDRPVEKKVEKVFNSKQPIMPSVIADTVFERISAECFTSDFFSSHAEFKKCRMAFRHYFEDHAETMAQQDAEFRKLATEDETQTEARDLLYVEARKVLKDWWDKAGYRIKGVKPVW